MGQRRLEFHRGIEGGEAAEPSSNAPNPRVCCLLLVSTRDAAGPREPPGEQNLVPGTASAVTVPWEGG